jgi:hypothetical protein
MTELALWAGGILSLVLIVSTVATLTVLIIDRRRAQVQTMHRETVDHRSLAVKEMDLALTELAKMNQRYAQALEDCLRAKANLEACKDETHG